MFFLCFFALYLACHSASPFLDDSGETVSVATLLGVGHPPGYPLHTLVARLAAGLPLGGPAEPVTLLAALFGAATACFVFVLSCAESGACDWLGAAVCALPAILLGLGPVFWHNALTAKGGIYQLNNLFSVLALGALGSAGEVSARRLRCFWLVLGLALAHHYMSQVPLLPAYAWLLWTRVPSQRSQGAWLALPGLALYGYIPLRSSLNPGLNWGGVHSLSGFLFFFFRLQYATDELSRSALTSLTQTGYALGLVFKEGTFVVLPAAALGVWIGRRERFTQALGLGWLLSLASVALYLNLKPQRLPLMRPYLFPAYLCQALLAGRAVAAGWRTVGARGRSWAAVGGLLACGALALARLPSLDLSGYYFALDEAHGLLTPLPAKALLLCQGDAVMFPLWYTQRVLKERRDVATVGLAVLPMDWVRMDLREHWPDLREPVFTHPIGAESVPYLTQATLDLNRQRPLYASFSGFDPSVQTWTLVSEGPDFRCEPSVAGAQAPAMTALQRQAAGLRLETVPLRGYTHRPLDADTLTYIVGDMGVRYNVLGLDAENAGDYTQALAFYTRAAQIAPQQPDFSFNKGNALYELGDKAAAVAAFGHSVEVAPGYVNGWYNQGVTLFQLGRLNEARTCLKRARALEPGREDILRALNACGGL